MYIHMKMNIAASGGRNMRTRRKDERERERGREREYGKENK